MKRKIQTWPKKVNSLPWRCCTRHRQLKQKTMQTRVGLVLSTKIVNELHHYISIEGVASACVSLYKSFWRSSCFSEIPLIINCMVPWSGTHTPTQTHTNTHTPFCSITQSSQSISGHTTELSRHQRSESTLSVHQEFPVISHPTTRRERRESDCAV